MELDDKYFENTEDVTREGLIGNYDHGNEPSHHIAYLYNWTNQPWKTQEKLRLIFDKMYHATTDGICGNDDCGQMSAWYVLSALGFYPVCPGTNEYVFGTPNVSEAKIMLENNKTFTIKTINFSKDNIYIQSVKLNGKPYTKTYILHKDIIDGGELIFTMGKAPNKNRGLKEEDKPFSISIKY
jgi:predicted alpha-1,2-mannosidase